VVASKLISLYGNLNLSIIYNPAFLPTAYDLGDAQERDDSQRRRLAQVLARRADTLILVTATPHAYSAPLLEPLYAHITDPFDKENCRSIAGSIM
jgi:hypothetical protein